MGGGSALVMIGLVIYDRLTLKQGAKQNGNPPLKTNHPKVEFSHNTLEEIPHEEITLFRQPDPVRAQTSRRRHPGATIMQRAQHQQRHLLQVA